MSRNYGSRLYINCIKEYFDKATRKAVAESLVLSQINYCNVICGSTNETQVQRVQKLQNFAAKVVHGSAKKLDRVTLIIKDFEWLNIEQQLKVDV